MRQPLLLAMLSSYDISDIAYSVSYKVYPFNSVNNVNSDICLHNAHQFHIKCTCMTHPLSEIMPTVFCDAFRYQNISWKIVHSCVYIIKSTGAWTLRKLAQRSTRQLHINSWNNIIIACNIKSLFFKSLSLELNHWLIDAFITNMLEPNRQ